MREPYSGEGRSVWTTEGGNGHGLELPQRYHGSVETNKQEPSFWSRSWVRYWGQPTDSAMVMSCAVRSPLPWTVYR